MTEPSLWHSFLAYLAREGYPVPEAVLKVDLAAPIAPSAGVAGRARARLPDRPEELRDVRAPRRLDEGVQEWRYRHVKMVERTIGVKPGSGGSTGAAYLRTTIEPAFPDLWAIRAQL